MVFGFSHAETTAWSNPYTIGFLVARRLAPRRLRLRRDPDPVSAAATPRRAEPDPRRVDAGHARSRASGIFGVFLFLTYYLQGTLGFSPVKTGVAFLPLVAGTGGHGPGVQPGPPAEGRARSPSCRSACSLSPSAMFVLHLVGLNSSYRDPRASLPHPARCGLRAERSPRPSAPAPWDCSRRMPAWGRPP